MSQSLIEVFELAECHQLEVNAGLAKPDAFGINMLSYSVLPQKTPLLVVSEEISVVKPVDGSIVVKAAYPYVSATGGYKGFSWVIEKSEHDSGDINRFVLGAVTKNIHNDSVLWTPIDTIEVWDVYDELKDDQLAVDILELLTATGPSIDIDEFLRLCDLIPDENNLWRLYMALINSTIKPEDIFSSIVSNGCVEDVGDYSYAWGSRDADLPVRYPVRKGDIFAFVEHGGIRKLAISKRYSDRKIKEKNILISTEYGFERAD